MNNSPFSNVCRSEMDIPESESEDDGTESSEDEILVEFGIQVEDASINTPRH